MTTLIEEARKTTNAAKERKRRADDRDRRRQEATLRRTIGERADELMAGLPEMVLKAAAEGNSGVSIWGSWGDPLPVHRDRAA